MSQLTMNDRQIEIEEESVFKGYQRYMRECEYAKTHSQEDETKPGRQLMGRAVATVGTAIEQDRNLVRPGKNRAAVTLMADLESEVLAWHALRALLSGISHETAFTSVAYKAGCYVRDEINFRRFSEHENTKYRITQEHLKQHRSPASRRAVMSKLTTGEGTAVVKWSNDSTIRVGTYLLDIAMRVTEWATAEVTKTDAKSNKRVIQGTPTLLAWIEKAHEDLALLTPVYQPMVVPPVPWTGPTEGGYLTAAGPRLTLVKTHNEEYLGDLEYMDMPEVYGAINLIQSTPWRINRGVMAVAEELRASGVRVGPEGDESLPSTTPMEPPAAPAEWDGMKYTEIVEQFPAEYKMWAQRAASVHEQNRRLFSKRLSAKAVLQLARKFEEDTLYFPHQMDFRGRVYPVSSYLSPQGDDLSKALLQFSEGKPLGSEGVKWLKIHIANSFALDSIDKASFADRIKWVEEHMDPIMESALNPLDPAAFWLEAEAPFQALAACFELAGWLAEGDEYVSHLPVSMDGSCNGLQNFSALLRDAVGGTATNLLPTDKPADIYSEVARVTEGKIRAAAEAGEELALIFDGFITRKLIKQPVMTLPYGATLKGMTKQIDDAVRKSGNPMGLTTKNSWSACGYLATVVRESIAEVVIAAVEAMDWLQKAARAASSGGHPVSWVTPSGFPVLQEYKMPKSKRMIVHIDGKRQNIYINEMGKKLDKQRQARSIAPNFVHSLDASHLMKTTILAEANGVSHFMMVHDSFGTHACDVGVLQACIREAFIEQYTPDVLGQFKANLEDQHDMELPALPEAGDLDLDLIRKSDFFFS